MSGVTAALRPLLRRLSEEELEAWVEEMPDTLVVGLLAILDGERGTS